MSLLIPNTPSVDGTVVSPELFDLAFLAPIFDDQPEYKGHRARLLDSELSNAAGQIKSRVAGITDNLKPSVVSGRTINIATGAARLPGGSNFVVIASTNILLPDNQVSEVWIDATGTLASGVTAPTLRVLIARVTVSGNAVTSLEDLRAGAGIPDIRPITGSIKTFGGNSVTDYTAANNEVFSEGVYYFRNFTVPAGVTISINRFARVFCSGLFDCQGTINVSPMNNGSAGIAVQYPNLCSIASTPGSGLGANGGGYPWFIQPFGSGGSNGAKFFYGGGTTNAGNDFGGDGGGGLWVEAARISVSGQINANGTNGSAITSATGTGILGTGGSGGTGGCIALTALQNITIANTATLNARGGNGGNAFQTNNTHGSFALGGVGGTGGVIALTAPVVTNNGTLSVAGGTTGNPATGTGATGLTNTGANTWVTNSGLGMTRPYGAAFGADNPGWVSTGSAHPYTITRVVTNGLVTTRLITPVG